VQIRDSKICAYLRAMFFEFISALKNSAFGGDFFMSDDRIPMTREGYEKLKADLDKMANHDMIEITKRVAAARDLGDLSENAEYHAAREDQGMLQAKVNLLRDKLARAFIIDMAALPKDTVVFGCRVKVKDLEYDDEEEFELVGPGEDDPNKNRILTTSPIGKGLIGKKKGDVAEIEVPKGMIRFEILEISFSA
jgi:transcription elongation factor GreA